MGRAIDMEKDIYEIKIKLKKLENIVRGMTHTMEDLEETLDVIIDEDELKEEKTNVKEKSNDEGNDAGSGKPNKRKTSTVSKTSKS